MSSLSVHDRILGSSNCMEDLEASYRSTFHFKSFVCYTFHFKSFAMCPFKFEVFGLCPHVPFTFFSQFTTEIRDVNCGRLVKQEPTYSFPRGRRFFLFYFFIFFFLVYLGRTQYRYFLLYL